MMRVTSGGESIWVGDTVRVIAGKFEGFECLILKRDPRFGLYPKYVWIRLPPIPGVRRCDSRGVKVPAAYVVVLKRA